MTRSLLPFLLTALIPFLGASCGATRPDVSGGARVALRDYRAGISLTVVSDGHLRSLGVEGETADLRRAAYYSELRGDVLTKVAEDDLVAGLILALNQAGLETYAQGGAAPGRGVSTSLEVERSGERTHFMYREGMAGAELEAYKDCRAAFMDVYNLIPQYQSALPEQLRFDTSLPTGSARR